MSAFGMVSASASASAADPDPERPASIWSTSLSVQPVVELHYRKADNLLYVFGENPERFISIHPEDGSIVQEFNVSRFIGVTSITRNVRVIESNGKELALLTVETGIDDDSTNGEGISSSDLVCWDFASQSVRWNTTAVGIAPPLVGNAAWSEDGQVLYHHFAGGEVYAINATTGDVLWIQNYFPMAGWTFLNAFLFGGILAEVGGDDISPGMYQIDAVTGEYVDRYRAPNLCFEHGSTFLAPSFPTTRQSFQEDNCNNIWSNSVPSFSKEFLYVMDDLFGLMKLNASDIAAGPIWTNAFAKDNDDMKSQQTYFPPVVSADDGVVFATAYWTTVAINAADGTTIWTISQDKSWLISDMVLSPFGDYLFLAFNFSIHKVMTRSGEIEFATDPSLVNSFVALNPEADVFFTAGVRVEAYESMIVAPGDLLSHGATGSASAGIVCVMHGNAITTAMLWLLAWKYA